MAVSWVVWMYLTMPLALVGGYAWHKRRRHCGNLAALRQAQAEGLGQPTSLHPVIDSTRCIGCGACVSACPEGDILGLIHGKSQLIQPSHCIGHGACKKACPVDAISLVFGTAERGVDIPQVDEHFETNLPGVYIAGELGGMGLIRNAVEQGRQALEAIARRPRNPGAEYDVLIVGAGPAGFSASLSALQHKLRYATIEQDSLGGTVFQFPRGKIVMTAPMKLALVGKVKITETRKEALLQMWTEIEKKTGVRIRYQERMEDIAREGDVYVVRTSKGVYRVQNVLLAIGRRGTPRKLDVPGEDLPKVVYRLIDPEQYAGEHVLVVGGGDSALEAALAIAEQPGSRVTLSYRSEAFSRVKDKNRKAIDEAGQQGKIKVILNSNVKEILPDKVVLKVRDDVQILPNRHVIICAGGVLPTPMLKKIGIAVETKYGTE